jgi:hypothetical protein
MGSERFLFAPSFAYKSVVEEPADPAGSDATDIDPPELHFCKLEPASRKIRSEPITVRRAGRVRATPTPVRVEETEARRPA